MKILFPLNIKLWNNCQTSILLLKSLIITITGITLIGYFFLRANHCMTKSRSPENAFCDVYDDVRCANGGTLEVSRKGFTCKCPKNFYGQYCTEETLWSRWFYSEDADVRRGMPRMWWSLLPFTSGLRLKTIYSFHQNQLKKLDVSASGVGEKDSKGNMTSTRILPPSRPLHCSVDKRLPSMNALYGELFQRKPDQFVPDLKNRNLLFQTFYQYFVLQFFDTEFKLTVTASQLYGTDEITKRELRSFTGGKLKTEILNDEHYPPYLSSAKLVKMIYPPTKHALRSHWFNRITMYSNTHKSPKLKWAMGHPLLSMNSMLFAMSTLWVREHNRVCDVLVRKWPGWTDDQIHDSAKKIIIGEMMTIMMNDVINAHTGHAFSLKPEIFHRRLQNMNTFTTPFELLFTTFWPSNLPEQFINNVSMDSTFFSNNRQVFEDGMSDTVRFMVKQKMGMVTFNNDGAATEPLTKLMITLSRQNALQSFNNYRRRLGLRPYKSFYDLTENRMTVEKLKTLYDDIENVELLTGILVEKRIYGVLPTATVMTNSFIVNSILTNALTSKHSWKPDTFGGKVGFDIIKSANIEKFVCNNLVDKCNGYKIDLYTK